MLMPGEARNSLNMTRSLSPSVPGQRSMFLCSHGKRAEIKVQNRSAGKTAIHRDGTVIFEDVLVDFLQTRINEKYDKRKKGNSQDS